MAIGNLPETPVEVKRMTDREIGEHLAAWAALFPRDNAPDAGHLPFVCEAAQRLANSLTANTPGYVVDCDAGKHAFGKDDVCVECKVHRSETVES